MDDFTAQIMKLGYGPASSRAHDRADELLRRKISSIAKNAIDKMEQGIETRFAQVNADRSALKQPDDLKAVYDKTFDKLVTVPTLAMENSAKALDAGIDASIKLADYINSHRNRLTVSGMQIQAKDQRTLDEVRPVAEGSPGGRRALRGRATRRPAGLAGRLACIRPDLSLVGRTSHNGSGNAYKPH